MTEGANAPASVRRGRNPQRRTRNAERSSPSNFHPSLLTQRRMSASDNRVAVDLKEDMQVLALSLISLIATFDRGLESSQETTGLVANDVFVQELRKRRPSAAAFAHCPFVYDDNGVIDIERSAKRAKSSLALTERAERSATTVGPQHGTGLPATRPSVQSDHARNAVANVAPNLAANVAATTDTSRVNQLRTRTTIEQQFETAEELALVNQEEAYWTRRSAAEVLVQATPLTSGLVSEERGQVMEERATLSVASPTIGIPGLAKGFEDPPTSLA